MSVQGVPIDEVTAKDFIMVRAALVKRLGGANEALVWSRVHYRCDEDSRAAHDTESGRWWAATYDVVGAETGLTAKQARTALERLVAGGFLRAEQHRLRGNYDQTFSYQPVVAPGQMHVPSRADEGAQEGRSDLPSGADVPSTETGVAKATKTPAVETVGQRFAQPLVDVLVAELTRNEVKVPSPMSKRWLDAARLLVDADGRDPRQARALIVWACRDAFWRSNILSMPTFRAQYDKLRLARERQGGGRGSSTVEHGRTVDAILRERETSSAASRERQAVTA